MGNKPTVETQITLEDNESSKILFLGLPGSGSETIIKEFQKVFPLKKNEEYRSVLEYRAFQSIRHLFKGCETQQISLKKDEEKLSKKLKEIDFLFGITKFIPEISQKLAEIWKQKQIKEVYEGRKGLRLKNLTELEYVNYFLDNIERIYHPDYIPSDEDVEFAKKNFPEDIEGFEESKFEYDKKTCRVFSVEGQKNEKRNWINCLNGVDIVVYVCPIGDFDKGPMEGFENNIVFESLAFFEKMSNSQFFKETPIILIFTKFDEFDTKLRDTDLICCFSDYSGGCVSESAISFLTEKFFKARKSEKTDDIYIHFVQADTKFDEIITNIGGTLKNIEWVKKEEILEAERKRKKEEELRRQSSKTGSLKPATPTTGESPKEVEESQSIEDMIHGDNDGHSGVEM
eukprot:gene1723-492_t